MDQWLVDIAERINKARDSMQPPMTEDDVNYPAHYNQGDIECIDAIRSMLGKEGFIAYLRGNIAKYNWRLLHKGKALRDAQKLGWYQHRLEQELRDDGKDSETPIQGKDNAQTVT